MNGRQRRNWQATRDMFQRARDTQESPSGATMAGRRPYKCPCCDGYGKRQVIRQMMTAIIYEPCHACAGTGVVWG